MGEPGQPRVGRLSFLTDFGLARATATGSKLTRTGEALGTPAYMSPEQARGEGSGLTPATDVWSLGCLLYQLLAGRPPFEGATPAAVVGQILLAEPRALRSLVPTLPPGLDRLVGAALAKEASARFPDAAALRGDLDRVLRGERSRAKRRVAWKGMATTAALCGAAAAWGVSLAWPPRPEAAPAPIPSTPSEAQRLAARAKVLRTSDPREAAQWLGKALEAEPARHDWRLELGLLRWAVGRSPEARQEWSRACEAPAGSPERPLARLYLGLEGFFRLAGEEARPHLQALEGAAGRVGRLARGALAALDADWAVARTALRGEPGWEAALLRGYVEGWDPDGDKSAAVREYGAALADGIPFAWALNNRGFAKRAAGDLAGAMADFDAALALDPRDATAHYNRGLAHHASGALAAAIADYDRALALDPRYTKACFDRGRAKQEAGDLAGAITDYDGTLALAPRHSRALGNRANAKQASGDLAGAIADYDVALGLDPGYTKAFNNRGLAREASGDLAGAIADFDAALDLDRDYQEARYNRGLAKQASGDLAGAIADYDAALARDPGDTKALGNRGLARRALGQWDAAAASFREFLRLAPGDPRAGDIRRGLAECEAKARAAGGPGR